MSPPKYTVVYCNFRWIAEPIRNLLTLAGREFIDERESWEQWEKDPLLKQKYPYEKLPCLEERLEDGTTIKLSQSITILRYLGEKYGMSGSTSLEKAKCDEFADCLKDILKEVEQTWEADEATKEKVKASLLTKTFPRYFSVIEKELQQKKGAKGGSEFGLPLVGNKLTWVDILLANYTDVFELYLSSVLNLKDEKDGHPTILDLYPSIKEHQIMFFALDKIKRWIATRPVTPF